MFVATHRLLLPPHLRYGTTQSWLLPQYKSLYMCVSCRWWHILTNLNWVPVKRGRVWLTETIVTGTRVTIDSIHHRCLFMFYHYFLTVSLKLCLSHVSMNSVWIDKLKVPNEKRSSACDVLPTFQCLNFSSSSLTLSRFNFLLTRLF